MEIQPRHVVCVLHHAPTSIRETCARFPGFEYDTEYSQDAHDARMPGAFSASADRVVPSLIEADWQGIASHTAVSYVLSPRLTPETSLAVSRQMLSLVAAALQAGALAIKGESSGIAHGKERWLQLDARAQGEPEAALIRAWVRFPIASESVHYSVGMHLLGFPDVEVAPGELAEIEIVDTISSFLHFLLIDKPTTLASGHTFGLAPDARRFRLFKTECKHYEPDDFHFNPYGYWRLIPIT